MPGALSERFWGTHLLAPLFCSPGAPGRVSLGAVEYLSARGYRAGKQESQALSPVLLAALPEYLSLSPGLCWAP